MLKNITVEQLRAWARSQNTAVRFTPDGAVCTAGEGDTWEERSPIMLGQSVAASFVTREERRAGASSVAVDSAATRQLERDIAEALRPVKRPGEAPVMPAGERFRSVGAVQLDAQGYDSLAGVLLMAFNQASAGKGRERHANGLPFDQQPMTAINELLGSSDGYVYQAIKKAVEAKRLPPARAIAELLGAINYLAGAVLHIQRHQADAANDSQVNVSAHG